MTLENLLKIGQLKSHVTDAVEVGRLLAASKRNLTDAALKGISSETRFDVAYKAIMQCALVALMANGFRPDTKRPGYHMTTLQSLPLTIQISVDRVVVLDALQRKRNLSDYTGEDIDDVSAENCVCEAQQLIQETKRWLQKNWPLLLESASK
ncbi:MAG: DNA-binding protein [Gammaproteobacteria bacterium]|nr:DNA-binding protein [Gammaproteobacteria bacterium]